MRTVSQPLDSCILKPRVPLQYVRQERRAIHENKRDNHNDDHGAELRASMASVAALRIRLEALSSAIHKQKEALRRITYTIALRALEQIKSDVERELNAILDPISRLPIELSSEIMLRAIPDIPRPHLSRAPLIFLEICHSWRNIALSTPALWAVIQIDSSRVGKIHTLFETWVGRARTLPLTVSVTGFLDISVHDLLYPHAHRIQNLKLRLDTELEYALEDGALQLPSLKYITIGSKFTMMHRQGWLFNAHGCVEILRAAPNLVECNFDSLYYEEDIHAIGDTSEPLIHLSLQCLRLGKDGGHPSSACMLQYLTLPNLKTLHLTSFDISHEDFLSFLERSLPPLQSLSMNIPNEGWPPSTVLRYFSLLPNLTDLELHQNDPSVEFSFLDVLAAAGADFLPDLCSLSIHGFFPDRPQYERLITLLTGERQFQSFQLFWPLLDWGNAPEADITQALLQLRANGMHIHVGIKEISYV
ncbi:hypothetical protein B0H15DRAFT_135899 [Mycena belliarum]|uniref:F-box domain-containing protein n=1 Tax=Mycena belliarum TaxID=1033014 RepID=A0AAD6UB53_9AGAR|nr:hypothetical protein B0H15DRAFT_135899 [Mycena belliae]